MKWREGFKNFERCEKRKRQWVMVVDASTCRAIEGVGEMSNQCTVWAPTRGAT